MAQEKRGLHTPVRRRLFSEPTDVAKTEIDEEELDSLVI